MDLLSLSFNFETWLGRTIRYRNPDAKENKPKNAIGKLAGYSLSSNNGETKVTFILWADAWLGFDVILEDIFSIDSGNDSVSLQFRRNGGEMEVYR